VSTQADVEAVKESRARVLHAANAERRRIERSLHDGVQQHLVAIAVRVRLAKDLIFEDPDEACRLLDQLGDDIRGSLNELRTLAHHIYPALLVDGGLVDALPVAASRTDVGARVETKDLKRYAPDVEAAVYFSCAETLGHLARAGQRPVKLTVRVWDDGGSVLFEVAGDGDALALLDGTEELALMADRLAAVGGTIAAEVVDSEGGRRSRVHGAIPQA
jgi:signal transduction histidine kinase